MEKQNVNTVEKETTLQKNANSSVLYAINTKKGHNAPVCKSPKTSQVHVVEEKLSDSEENTNEEFDDYSTTSKVDQKIPSR